MITPSRSVRVFGYPAPCDMRKGYDSLGALVRDSLEQELLYGDMFLFVARNRKRAKVLFFDGTGLFLLCVRLEKGTFASLRSEPGAAEAKKHLRNIRDEIADLHLQLQLAEADSPVQLDLLEKFQGIKLAEYSLEEQRELLRIVVRDIRLRFDRMFITYNLYEAPGKLYVGEVKVPRRPTHNSKLRQK